MNASLILQNLAIYSVHITAVIAPAALCVWMFRLQSPRARLAVWHIALALCLVLPLIAPWQRFADPVAGSQVAAASGPLVPIAGDEQQRGFEWPLSPSETVLFVACGGTMLRLLWLLLGLMRLRGMARRAEVMRPAPAPVERARWLAGADARFCWSDEITGPVTFGLRPPIVLLPPGFARLSEAEQTSIALHEALHVARRDWVFTICEEVVRALLWFHPAIWFLLNRAQLAREQAVDRTVVECTSQADEYVDALLKIAAARIEPDLAPAPLFLKRRHLRERVDALVKGAYMTKSRLVLSMFAVLLIVPVIAGLIAWQLPLRAAAQSNPPDSAGVEVKTGPFQVVHRAPVTYPVEARDAGVPGTVVINITINREGEVTDARVVSSTGPQELRRAALSSVLQWHFATDPVEVAPGDRRPMPSSFEIAIGFNPEKTPKMPEQNPGAPASVMWTVDKIDLSRTPAMLHGKIQSAMTVREGQSVRPEEVNEQQNLLRKVDSHLMVAVVRPRGPNAAPDTVSLQVVLRQPAVTADRVIPPAGDTGPQKIRVGGNLQANNLITKVTPAYPPEAKAARIEGVVKFTATIGPDGRVEHLELISGHPILVPGSVEAVKQWVYRPTLLNGNPVSVVTQIDINYTLAP